MIFFPRGRYRIDAILRSGTWIESPLLIPENITLRGEGADLTSLWWPDHEKPLMTLIDGRNDFAIEEMSIYTQGPHSTIITGTSNVRIKNVRIRANCYYMTNNHGGSHHLRKVAAPGASGAAILLWGVNNQVTGCDIFNSAMAFDIRIGRGNFIASNTVRASNSHFLSGVSEMIYENNTFTGNGLTAGGGNIALHFGGSSCRHVYYAHNFTSHIYGGDHEALTFDGHHNVYFGKARDIQNDSLTLTGKLADAADLHDSEIYILDGCGSGQHRAIKTSQGSKIWIDREWDVTPDENSIMVVNGFNGRHLIIGNTATDAGTLVQLYPPNCECIVAGNKSIRASNINCIGKIGYREGQDLRWIEPSWCNQFLDNEVVVGNAWGGGCTYVDRWLGGECRLDIWGWEINLIKSNGIDIDRFFDAENLRKVTGEPGLREKSIPISSFHVVRRHKVHNNSSIKVHGAVANVLIEGCDLNKSAKGIRIEHEIYFDHPPDIGQLFDFDPEPSPKSMPLPFLSPEGVLLRNNHFQEVKTPYSGTALGKAMLVSQ